MVFVVALTAALCALQLMRPGVLFGLTEYDDGVFLGSATRLANGILPYKDFSLVEPPGLTLLLQPIALLTHQMGTRNGLAMARLVTAAVCVLNVYLASSVVRHRGAAAVLITGLGIACFPLAATTEHTLSVEPYLLVFCLMGLRLLFRDGQLSTSNRPLAAGLVFGFAGTIYLWAVFPLAIAALAVLIFKREQIVRLVAGAALAFIVPCLPFLLIAPRNFIHESIVSPLIQVPVGNDLSPGLRVLGLSGLEGLSAIHATPAVAVLWTAALTLLVAAAFVFSRRALSPLEWVVLGSALASSAIMFLPHEFFEHWALFPVSYLAMLLGLAGARLGEISFVRRFSDRRRPATILAVGILTTGLIAIFLTTQDVQYIWKSLDAGDPGPVLAQVIPAGACVISEEPDFTITANRFVSQDAHCPVVVDPSGQWMVTDPKHMYPTKGPFSGVLVATWEKWMSESTYVVLGNPNDLFPWSTGFKTWFDHHYKIYSNIGGLTFKKITPPAG